MFGKFGYWQGYVREHVESNGRGEYVFGKTCPNMMTQTITCTWLPLGLCCDSKDDGLSPSMSFELPCGHVSLLTISEIPSARIHHFIIYIASSISGFTYLNYICLRTFDMKCTIYTDASTSFFFGYIYVTVYIQLEQLGRL